MSGIQENHGVGLALLCSLINSYEIQSKRYDNIGINLDLHLSASIDSGTSAFGIGMRNSNLPLVKVAVVEAELKRQIRPSVTE